MLKKQSLPSGNLVGLTFSIASFFLLLGNTTHYTVQDSATSSQDLHSPVIRAAVSDQEALLIAKEAYIYGYPLITMEMTRRVMTNVVTPEKEHAPMGQFYNSRTYPTAAFRDVTAPNADTLYSTAWLDVSEEPYILSLPDMKNRYFLMPMLDGWTNVIAVPGKRTTGDRAQTYAITGPNWRGKLPEGVTEIKSPTAMVWILGRTYASGTAADYKAVHALQDQYKLFPLRYYGKPYTPPVGKVNPAIDMKTSVRDQVNALSASAYFSLLAQLLEKNPPSAADKPIVERMAKIGIVPGQKFDASKLSPGVVKGLTQIPQEAFQTILARETSGGMKVVNGWIVSLETGKYGTDYLQRAFISAIGLGANLPQDAVYPVTQKDGQNQQLSGANNYVLRFPKGQTPPADGFWSLTMYDSEYFFVNNPLNKYTVSPRNALKYNADGSLDIYIQNQSPGKDKEANWLPAPEGKFILMLRLYWPKEKDPSILNDSWKPPVVQRVS